jgi:predicted DNA-binding transcriptional regulator AlpA
MENLDVQLYSLAEQLDRIEKKLDGKYSNKFLDMKQVVQYSSTSASTIRRAIVRGELKCSKKLGKLLFKVESVDNWLGGK